MSLVDIDDSLSLRPRLVSCRAVGAQLGGEAGAAAAGFGGVGVDEVEALAHEGFFVVEDHAAEVDETLGVDEETDGGRVGEGRVEVRLGEGVDAVALAGLGVELDGVAEAGAAASGDADAEAAGFGRDAFLGHGDADALEGAEGNLNALDGAGFAFGGEDRRWGCRRDRGGGYRAFGGFGLEGDHGHRDDF